jgi:cytochrome c
MQIFDLKAATITASLMFLASSGSALALDGEALFKSPQKGGCTACHGKDAKTPLMPMYPKLAGQNAAYLVQQLKDIKSGARNNGQSIAMKGIMHMVNDEEIEAIAQYLSTLQP